MAKKMALVPESWLHRNFGDNSNQNGSSERQAQVVVEPQEETSDLLSIAELLPKCYRTKAKMILHYLQGTVRINDMQRIQYDDGSVGSHIVDLIRYFVSPFVKERPIDAPKFMQLMKRVGVPNSALAKADIKKGVLSQWKTYK